MGRLTIRVRAPRRRPGRYGSACAILSESYDKHRGVTARSRIDGCQASPERRGATGVSTARGWRAPTRVVNGVAFTGLTPHPALRSNVGTLGQLVALRASELRLPRPSQTATPRQRATTSSPCEHRAPASVVNCPTLRASCWTWAPELECRPVPRGRLDRRSSPDVRAGLAAGDARARGRMTVVPHWCLRTPPGHPSTPPLPSRTLRSSHARSMRLGFHGWISMRSIGGRPGVVPDRPMDRPQGSSAVR